MQKFILTLRAQDGGLPWPSGEAGGMPPIPLVFTCSSLLFLNQLKLLSLFYLRVGKKGKSAYSKRGGVGCNE